jgi:SAM-dependent methyltransferase
VPVAFAHRARSGHKGAVPNAEPPLLFDRALLAARLERAYRAAPGNPSADFLLRRAAEELSDRLSLVRRVFAVAAEVGAPGPHAAEALAARSGGGWTLRLAPSPRGLARGAYLNAVGDVERLPLADESCDLIVSLLALHHVNDLPGALIQMRRALRPDGLFLAALAGGDTLTELRQSLTIAESEVLGGAAPRVAPFAEVRALGGLMQRAGFALPVVDADPVVARYGDLFALMRDLRAFGATNALTLRSRKPLRRDVLMRAASVYAERFADSDGRLRATFDTIWLTGWAPHESQPKPLKPGSAKMRLADALNARKDVS